MLLPASIFRIRRRKRSEEQSAPRRTGVATGSNPRGEPDFATAALTGASIFSAAVGTPVTSCSIRSREGSRSNAKFHGLLLIQG
jgi:hypothetical protein